MKTKRYHFLIVIVPLLLPLFTFSQQLKLGNNPAAINKAAVLELESNLQGLLLTRIADTAVAPLTTAPDGTILFFKGDNSLRVRSGGVWRKYLTTIDTSNIASFSQKVRSLFTGTAPLTYNNGVIGITQASASANGYLSSSDWTTFNNKLSAIDTGNIANFYTKVRSELRAGTGLTYDNATGVISLLPGSGTSWLLGGNNVSAMQNLGTTNNYDLPFITNNTERMRIAASGDVGIANTNPQAKLDVGGNFKLGAGGTALTNIIKGTFSINDGASAITYSSSVTKTVTVTGAALNASVIINPRAPLANGVSIAYAYVSATNTVTINFTNSGAGLFGIQYIGNVTFDVTVINR